MQHVLSGPHEPQPAGRNRMRPVRDHAAEAEGAQEPAALGHLETWVVQEDSAISRGADPVPSRCGCARFGTTQSSGSATRTRTVAGRPWGGHRQRCSHAAAARPTDWARRAATSAVSAGCTRLPVAKTPGVVVVPSASQAGPLVPGSIAETRQAGQLVVGDEVPAEDDDVDGNGSLGAVGSPEEHPVHSVAPGYTGHRGPGPDRHPEADAGQRGRRAGTSACAGGR